MKQFLSARWMKRFWHFMIMMMSSITTSQCRMWLARWLLWWKTLNLCGKSCIKITWTSYSKGRCFNPFICPMHRNFSKKIQGNKSFTPWSYNFILKKSNTEKICDSWGNLGSSSFRRKRNKGKWTNTGLGRNFLVKISDFSLF